MERDKRASRLSSEAAKALRREAGSLVLSASLSDAGTIFGLSSPIPLPAPAVPVTRVVEWPWLRPLACILRLGGCTIDDVVSRPRVAAEVRGFWKLWKASERLNLQRQLQNDLEAACWSRKQGCPVPCPLCGAGGNCACSEAQLVAPLAYNGR